MTSNEILTHALELMALRRCLDHGSPKGHEHGGIAACRQVQKAAERMQCPVDVTWTRLSRPQAGCAAWSWRSTWRQSQDLLGALDDDGGQIEILATRESCAMGRGSDFDEQDVLNRAAAGFPLPYPDPNEDPPSRRIGKGLCQRFEALLYSVQRARPRLAYPVRASPSPQSVRVAARSSRAGSGTTSCCGHDGSPLIPGADTRIPDGRRLSLHPGVRGDPWTPSFAPMWGRSAVDRPIAKFDSVVTFEPSPVSHGESNSP